MGRIYRVPFEAIAVTAAQDLIEIFNHLTPVTVDVGAAGASAGATSVPCNALSGPIPSGAILDFGTTKFAVLTADAATGATSLTVRAIPTALVDADVTTYIGPSNVMLAIRRIHISQEVSETSEQKAFRVIRRTGTRGTGGSAVTPIKTSQGDAAASFCAQRNVTTPATASDVLEREGQNFLNGYGQPYTPEEVILVKPGTGVGINLPTAPDASTTMSGYAIVEELG